MKIYHNPRCRKSRETLALIEGKNITPEIILYLEKVPSRNEIRELLKKLDIPAEQLIRKTEPIFKTNFKGKKMTEEKWVDAMVKYPKLIERPIVILGNKAVLGRPPENVLELL